MRDYLVFQLYGPLTAWGDIAVGETRPSSLTPTKSAILGLIAAAVGLKRPDTIFHEGDERRTSSERLDCDADHARLVEGYGVAVQTEALGLPLSDYHTAEVPKGAGYQTRRDEMLAVREQKRNGNFKGTILSRREYRQDAFHAVALWARSNAPYTLDQLRDNLLEPRFIIYLGRKSCPLALPMRPSVVKGADCVENALRGISLNAAFTELDAARRGRPSDLLRYFQISHPLLLWDEDAEIQLTAEETISRRDVPISRRRWQFAVREEHRAHPISEESS